MDRFEIYFKGNQPGPAEGLDVAYKRKTQNFGAEQLDLMRGNIQGDTYLGRIKSLVLDLLVYGVYGHTSADTE